MVLSGTEGGWDGDPRKARSRARPPQTFRPWLVPGVLPPGGGMGNRARLLAVFDVDLLAVFDVDELGVHHILIGLLLASASRTRIGPRLGARIRTRLL